MAMPAVLTKNRHPLRNTYTPAARPAGSSSRSARPARARTSGIDPAAFRRAGVWLGGLGVVLLIFFLLSMGLMRLYRYCITSEYFQIDEIIVEGARQLTEDDILALSGLHEGENSLSVHIPHIEENLLRNPWVESVSIRRELPNRFIIHINERIPQFWILKEGTLHYLDRNGLLIAPVESSNFQSLPTLDIGPGGEEALPHLGDFMEQLSSTELPFELSQISWLRISAGKGFELYWENKHLSLSIGVEHWKENLRRLSLVIEDMENRGEIGLTREIHAADGQVWLQKV